MRIIISELNRNESWTDMLPETVNSYIKKILKHKVFIIIVWGIFLGIHTWTDNLGALLSLQSIGFRWNPSPNFLSFFYLSDITQIHQDFFIIKLGHFTGFAIFDFLIFNWIRNHKWSLIASILFAVTTEILQLFFERDGRLYDVIIDSLGALTVYYILKKPKAKKWFLELDKESVS